LTGPGRAAEKPNPDKREGQASVKPTGRRHTAVMETQARNPGLRDLREEYCLAPRSAKSLLLDGATKRTGLARKVTIRKLTHPATLVRRPRPRRHPVHGAAVRAALIELGTLFDHPCGQRLVALLRE